MKINIESSPDLFPDRRVQQPAHSHPNSHESGLMISATTLCGDSVYNSQGDRLGRIKDIMLDMDSGLIRYVVMSYGGVVGFGKRLFVIPWGALDLDPERRCFTLNVGLDRLKDAPGLKRKDWPTAADEQWSDIVQARRRRYHDRPKTTH